MDYCAAEYSKLVTVWKTSTVPKLFDRRPCENVTEKHTEQLPSLSHAYSFKISKLMWILKFYCMFSDIFPFHFWKMSYLIGFRENAEKTTYTRLRCVRVCVWVTGSFIDLYYLILPWDFDLSLFLTFKLIPTSKVVFFKYSWRMWSH